MKHILALTLAAFVAMWSVAAAETYDSETATVQKSGAHSAKITVGKDEFKAPICFGDGADWSSVKDHYEMNPAAISGLKSGKMCIEAESDGTLKYCSSKGSCSKK